MYIWVGIKPSHAADVVAVVARVTATGAIGRVDDDLEFKIGVCRNSRIDVIPPSLPGWIDIEREDELRCFRRKQKREQVFSLHGRIGIGKQQNSDRKDWQDG